MQPGTPVRAAALRIRGPTSNQPQAQTRYLTTSRLNIKISGGSLSDSDLEGKLIEMADTITLTMSETLPK
jgi:hypothetical protein